MEKNDEIQGIRKVGLNYTKAIDNAYYVKGLQHNLLSVSQMCEKGNNVMFTSNEWRMFDSISGNWFFVERGIRMYTKQTS